MTSETREGKTPAGGVKSTIFYQDDDEQPAEKEQASRAMIVEFDAQGKPLRRTYGTFGSIAQHAAAAPTQYARDNLPDPDMELWQEVLYVVPANRSASLPHECGVVKGLKVFLVDGNEIKLRDRKGDKNRKGDDSFMEFVEGGNGREDSELCGPDEVYLDANLDPVCYPFVCYHECQESADMKGGMTYDQAHERANHAEKILREKFPDPWKEK